MKNLSVIRVLPKSAPERPIAIEMVEMAAYRLIW
jgi:hypothetical protein